MQETAVARVSDDFYPRNPASSYPHIAACAFNGFFLSAILHVRALPSLLYISGVLQYFERARNTYVSPPSLPADSQEPSGNEDMP